MKGIVYKYRGPTSLHVFDEGGGRKMVIEHHGNVGDGIDDVMENVYGMITEQELSYVLRKAKVDYEEGSTDHLYRRVIEF